MGRALTLMTAMFAGARVAGQLTYIPAHISGGKKINSRCVIPIYCNSNHGTDPKTGEKGRSDSFKFVAWGKLADVCCKSLPKGKALDVITKPQSYPGKVFGQDGQPRHDTAGVVIVVEKTSFVIHEINFGEESEKVIAEEIQQGRRPINWQNRSHPDYEMWIQILRQRQATVWDGRSQIFGYSRVAVPQGPGIVLDFSANQPAPQQYSNPVQNGYANPNMQQGGFNQNLPNMVANAFGGNQAPAGNPAPLFDSMTGMPIAQPTPPAAKFDQYTGKPISTGFTPQAPQNGGFPPVGPQAPVTPMTGQSLF